MTRALFICEVALDEQNGAGIRAIFPYLSTLAPAWDSLYVVGPWPSRQETKSDIRFHRLAWNGRAAGLPALAWRCWRHIKATCTHDTFALVLPNSLADVVMGAVALLAGVKTWMWWMDDVEARLSVGASWPRRLFQRLLFLAVHRLAHKRLAVGPALAAALKERYGSSCDMALGKTQPTWSSPATRRGDTESLRLVYLGIYQGFYHEALALLRQTLVAYPQLRVSLDIWGQVPPPAELLLAERIRFCGTLSDEELLPRLAQYDAAYLGYSFDALTFAMMRYSFPSKLVDYLAAGLPVLSVVPPGFALAADSRLNAIGPVLHHLSAEKLHEALLAMQSWDEATWQRHRESARDWAQAFDPRRAKADLARLAPLGP